MPKKSRGSSRAWFYAVRGSYLPRKWQGWLLYIPFTAFLVVSLLRAIDLESSVAAVCLTVFPQWVAAAVVMTWIAKSTSLK